MSTIAQHDESESGSGFAAGNATGLSSMPNRQSCAAGGKGNRSLIYIAYSKTSGQPMSEAEWIGRWRPVSEEASHD